MNILVVCHGNVCRSPLAEVALIRALPTYVTVTSAGFVGPGRLAAKKVREYATSHNYDLSQHRSKIATLRDLHENDLILYMDEKNLNHLNLLSIPAVSEKAISLGTLVGLQKIQDPAFIPRGEKLDEILGTIVQACKNLAAYIRARKDPRLSARVSRYPINSQRYVR